MVLKREYQEEYREPTKDDVIEKGRRYTELPSPYEVFMNEENLPIYRGLGVYDCRQVPLAPWKRLGGRGGFIQLDGQAGVWGLYVVEIPAGGVLNPERHMYEEVFVVIEGRGSTEVWREGSSKKLTFEWQQWSRFALPLNVWHRMVNATSSPALLLGYTSAPTLMKLFPSRSYIFENPYEFRERFDESEDYFKPKDELIGTMRGLAAVRTNLIPDIAHCYLPLANTRGAGHRRLEPWMAGNTFFGGGFIAEYPIGRYSMGHYHASGLVLLCLRGKGYTYNWPVELSKRPWEAGKGHLVKRQDYIPGGLVAAAPGAGNWYHQHFGCGSDVFRVMAMGHQPLGHYGTGAQGGEERVQGENAILYHEEDPSIRKEYQKTIAKDGIKFTLPEALFQAPSA